MTQHLTAPGAVLEKEARLKGICAGYGSLAVAYSGGVDSTYLADVASEVLGQNAHIILADSPSIPRSEVREASELAQTRGWNFVVVHTNEFSDENYLKNAGNRCYFCRAELFTHMSRYAIEHNVAVIAYGEITDDLKDTTRVGSKAAKEFRVAAPLVDAGLSKNDIRALSTLRALPTADKASFACLSSRVPVGTRVNPADLAKIEQAEDILKAAGFKQYRARHHGDICRIEIDMVDLPLLLDGNTREQIMQSIKAVGYRYVALDLAGYRNPG